MGIFSSSSGSTPRSEIVRLQRRIDTLERQIVELAKLVDVDPRRLPQAAPVCSPQVVELAQAGKQIEAIKLHREQTGADLLTAKNDVEAIR